MSPQPTVPEIIIYEQADGGSIPSTYSSNTAVVWGFLALGHYRSVGLVLVLTSAVMLSRVYLGGHHVGDVLVGATVGLGILLLARPLWNQLRRRVSQRSITMTLGSLLLLAVIVLPFIGLDEIRPATLGAVVGAGIGLLTAARTNSGGMVTAAGCSHQILWRFELGTAGVGVLMLPLALVSEAHPAMAILVFAAIGFWLTYGAPYLFRWFHVTTSTVQAPAQPRTT